MPVSSSTLGSVAENERVDAFAGCAAHIDEDIAGRTLSKHDVIDVNVSVDHAFRV